uniref:NR LBD domain-containing protein n=1 Tax=Panagrolaimus superbus TaxID=310955 RepID=A0A914YQW6_9BILA
MDVYEKKYPTLANMLQIYLNFTKLRFDQYQRDEREPEVKSTFNYIDYIRMNHFDAENGMALFEKFPYFCELPESDKSALFKRFREPFLLFERIYDTLNIVGSKLDDKYIMLQNGDCFNFATLNQAFMPREMSNVFKIIFSSWAAFLPVIRKMNLEIIEAVYIFCCLLWNTSYLDSPISKEGEEIIRRGRIIIHKEMREFYDYDEIKWERIYSLRNFLIKTEKFVAEYKKQVVVDM